MLDCPACLQRCLRAVVRRPNAPLAFRRNVSLPTQLRNNHPRVRPYSTAIEVSRDQGFITARQKVRGASNERWYPGQTENARILAHKHRTHGPRDAVSDHNSDFVGRQLRSELSYLQDPLKLSDRVWQLLHQNDSEKATALVRLACAKIPCVVSWNHIIDWNMSRGKANTAMKIYNEMKKRAQFPDSHTYLLLLRGFADNPELPNSLGNALAIYHSMSAINARVPPSIIHSNAMLKVCVRANNQDALWGVLSRLPEEGFSAPDNITFTTVLNALSKRRYDIETEQTTDEELAARREEAVIEGRQLWDHVVRKWRKGSILIDADLVNAMGRLLLTGVRARDWDDVLSLLQQAMDIDRLVPPFGSPERQESHIAPRLRAPHVPAGLKMDIRLKNNVPNSGEDEPQPRGEFDSIRTSENGSLIDRSSSPTFAQPDNNTMSLVIEACLKMAAKKLADQYWDIFTQKYHIVPDLDNVNVYLRCLRQYRASSQTMVFLRTQLAEANIAPLPKTFRIAMSCCVRDHRHPLVMASANELLDFMEKKIGEHDPRTLSMYLDVAMKTGDNAHQLYAITRVQKITQDMKSKISYADKSTPSAREEALDFLKKLVWAYHIMLKDDSLMPGPRAKFQARRAQLQAYLDRQKPTVDVFAARNQRMGKRRGPTHKIHRAQKKVSNSQKTETDNESNSAEDDSFDLQELPMELEKRETGTRTLQPERD